MHYLMMYLDFPSECRHYFGPHSVSCLLALWNNSECSERGAEHPYNLDVGRKAEFDSMDLRYIYHLGWYFSNLIKMISEK